MVFESPQKPPGDLLAQEIAREQSKGKLFLRLFLQNERRLYAYVLTLVPNRADADDVFQDASLTMWDKFDSASPPDDFAAWGCRIAYFKVLDFRKKGHRSRLMFNQELLQRLADTALAQAGALQLEERRQALAGCIAKLAPPEQDLLSRRFGDGTAVGDIAAQRGRSADAIYKTLAKIRQVLFECVTRTLAREA